MILLCIIFSLLAITIILAYKVILLKKNLRKICKDVDFIMEHDTNLQISLLSRDRDICLLADRLNIRLEELQNAMHHCHEGDMELKSAISGISHDLRTPLTTILGYLDLLSDSDTEPVKTQEYIVAIKDRAEHLKYLTDDLFAYSLSVSQDGICITENITVNDVLEECIAGAYRQLKERGIAPRIDITEEKVTRNLDPSALTRIFENLLSNAVRYSAGDLTIKLDASGRITFSNTAPLLDEVSTGKIFDRFYTVENARRSTGLGLSIAKVLTEKMGGEISASYKDGILWINLTF